MRHALTMRALAGAFKRLSPNACLLCGWLLAAAWLCAPNPAFGKGPDGRQTYGPLLDFIRMEKRTGPLVEFMLKGQGIDQDLHDENRRFISQSETLLDNIRQELDSDNLDWQLREATRRLMVVPENHPEYAALFENYCRSVIDHVLGQTRLPNPYGAIATLEGPPADTVTAHENGIRAFLVHNIADVYTEEYVFFDHRRSDRKISIKLNNRVYPGEIGSYSSYLVIQGDQRYAFERSTYTLWRNSAENPLNVFIAPVEETLHIALREATEAAIIIQLAEERPSTRTGIQAVVDEWLAVEEAIVGGLVNELLPGILDRFLATDAALDIARSFAERRAFDKYRYLEQGIAVVGRMGVRPAIRIYRDHPGQFRALLTSPPPDPGVQPGKPAEKAGRNRPAA